MSQIRSHYYRDGKPLYNKPLIVLSVMFLVVSYLTRVVNIFNPTAGVAKKWLKTMPRGWIRRGYKLDSGKGGPRAWNGDEPSLEGCQIPTSIVVHHMQSFVRHRRINVMGGMLKLFRLRFLHPCKTDISLTRSFGSWQSLLGVLLQYSVCVTGTLSRVKWCGALASSYRSY